MATANQLRFKRMMAEAKRIRAKHPGKAWNTCVKEAGKKISGTKIGKAPKKRKSVTVRVRVGAAPKPKPKPRPGIQPIGSADVHLRHAREIVKNAIGTKLAQQFAAKTKTEKRQIGKKIADLKKRYNRLK
jgi:hypothetical protein